jgi:hypothetical protein
MLKYLIASAMMMALAAPAFAQTAPAGGIAGTTSANALASQRSFDPVNGASIFGGRSQGEFGALQAVVAPPSASVIGEPAGPYGQVILKDGYWNGTVPWTQH